MIPCEHGFSPWACVRCQQEGRRSGEVVTYLCPCGETKMPLVYDLPPEATGFSSLTVSCERCLGSLTYPQQPNHDPRQEAS